MNYLKKDKKIFMMIKDTYNAIIKISKKQIPNFNNFKKLKDKNLMIDIITYKELKEINNKEKMIDQFIMWFNNHISIDGLNGSYLDTMLCNYYYSDVCILLEKAGWYIKYWKNNLIEVIPLESEEAYLHKNNIGLGGTSPDPGL